MSLAHFTLRVQTSIKLMLKYKYRKSLLVFIADAKKLSYTNKLLVSSGLWFLLSQLAKVNH